MCVCRRIYTQRGHQKTNSDINEYFPGEHFPIWNVARLFSAAGRSLAAESDFPAVEILIFDHRVSCSKYGDVFLCASKLINFITSPTESPCADKSFRVFKHLPTVFVWSRMWVWSLGWQILLRLINTQTRYIHERADKTYSSDSDQNQISYDQHTVTWCSLR